MRSFIATLAAALATFVAIPAFADSNAKFPMPAAEFKQKVDTRMAKARQRMEAHASKLTADQAKELRAKFDAGAAKVNEEVARATADGTVTAEEAKNVRAAKKAMHPHQGGKHARRGKHPKK